jgi:hypothetical protein
MRLACRFRRVDGSRMGYVDDKDIGEYVGEAPNAKVEVCGWFLDAGRAGDFEKASAAFKKAAAIIDRLAQSRVQSGGDIFFDAG